MAPPELTIVGDLRVTEPTPDLHRRYTYVPEHSQQRVL
jgi:hypothetical protein